ncbi:hybrid sensor histidine kinase/response regulator [Bacteroides sp. 519]|uniref:hybrid sensor histidine kinase/response regulator n=1 Tax=Bacteroides sp. 519 TaxID=2302937 RepID=UPI0013D44587|nr:hybrid sensor histidine kinase/response regulator [Bacteroides sp. 519]
MRNSIETKIKLNALFIYLLVMLTCGGGFIYFYISWKNMHIKKLSVEVYNNELAKVNELVYAINDAQAEVNLFVITERRKHLRNFQAQAKEIGLRIDSLKNSEKDLGADTIFTEINLLLKHKEESIIRLTRQFTLRNPIDSLSETLSSYSGSNRNIADSISEDVAKTSVKAPKRSLWKRLFSSSKAENPVDTPQPESNKVVPNDTLPVTQIIQQARIDYDQHISAIENHINSVVLTDQYISSRISELLTKLYNQIIHLRMQDIEESETMLRENNISAIIIGSVALVLILISLILILRNVQKGYSARQALEKANQRTKQLMESRHQLLLSVSHDVKTPLNSMLGYIDMYKRNGLLSNAEVAPVYSSGNHILALLHNLLEFSGLEKGSVTLAPRSFSPQELCRELCEMFIPLAERKLLHFTHQEAFPEGIILFSDCLKIKQIITNILSNAIKYTTVGGVCIESIYQNQQLQFRVTDTGVGIAAEKQNNLFKPFSRVEENNVLNEGNGFGLFVVKGLVDLFGGEINFKSEQGKGTEVFIKLPVKEGKKKITNQQAKKILFIDDDSTFLEILSSLCSELGHEVTCCRNCNELKEELKDISSYHCVITDMEMGIFNGKDVLKEIRNVNTEIPVILITGRTDLSINTILAEGFADLLSKPVTLRELHAIIGGKLEHTSNNLHSLLNQDKEAIREIMENFIMATVNNIVLINNAITEKDFDKVQYLCHKMLPMFLQIQAPEDITHTLKHIDNMRGENRPDNSVWVEINEVIKRIENYLSSIPY